MKLKKGVFMKLENLNTKFIRELQKINDKENKKDK